MIFFSSNWWHIHISSQFQFENQNQYDDTQRVKRVCFFVFAYASNVISALQGIVCSSKQTYSRLLHYICVFRFSYVCLIFLRRILLCCWWCVDNIIRAKIRGTGNRVSILMRHPKVWVENDWFLLFRYIFCHFDRCFSLTLKLK